MATFPEERLRARRQLSERAISLAMASRWDEAEKVNRELLALFPEDVDSYNRLGKALTELGRVQAAKEAYGRASALDPTNAIASKNLQRLSKLAVEQSAATAPSLVDPSLFIEESGKTVITSLVSLATSDVLLRMTAGDHLELQPGDHVVRVVTAGGDVAGQIEPKLSKRMLALLEGGNRYQVTVTSVDEQSVRVIIRETYKGPRMAGKVSFPSKPQAEAFRGYIKDSLLKFDIEDDDDLGDDIDEGNETAREGEMGAEEPDVSEEPELPED